METKISLKLTISEIDTLIEWHSSIVKLNKKSKEIDGKWIRDHSDRIDQLNQIKKEHNFKWGQA